jgi:hypothetical protein
MILRSSHLLLWLLVGMGASASAQTLGFASANGEQQAARVAKEARVQRREEIKREEALAGRRLTAEERAQLREQLRHEWALRTESSQTAETQPADRLAPGSAQTRTRRQ